MDVYKFFKRRDDLRDMGLREFAQYRSEYNYLQRRRATKKKDKKKMLPSFGLRRILNRIFRLVS